MLLPAFLVDAEAAVVGAAAIVSMPVVAALKAGAGIIPTDTIDAGMPAFPCTAPSTADTFFSRVSHSLSEALATHRTSSFRQTANRFATVSRRREAGGLSKVVRLAGVRTRLYFQPLPV
jgi:hypothetical protein